MNIPPVLLLIMGSIFGLAYGLFITLGWAITRHNRKTYQKECGVDFLPNYNLSVLKEEKLSSIKSVSLYSNQFKDSEGKVINISDYKAFIAIGKSDEYPEIKNGNLIFIDDKGKICYAFEIPDLKNYR